MSHVLSVQRLKRRAVNRTLFNADWHGSSSHRVKILIRYLLV
ncbi:hypothetical protein PFLA_a1848 [Pseudoalteromonas flavipulchra NCIMB 2033 = ATCC BAA-314]|nr:hypothetical protein [Pseudoalteromonas flavipulchra NCIMB 2033 = ATCC BAA-314]